VLLKHFEIAVLFSWELFRRTYPYNTSTVYRTRHTDTLYQKTVNQVMKRDGKETTFLRYCLAEKKTDELLFLVNQGLGLLSTAEVLRDIEALFGMSMDDLQAKSQELHGESMARLGRAEQPSADVLILKGDYKGAPKPSKEEVRRLLKQNKAKAFIIDELEDKIISDPYNNYGHMKPSENDTNSNEKLKNANKFIYEKKYEPNKKRLDIVNKSSSMARSKFILKNKAQINLEIIQEQFIQRDYNKIYDFEDEKLRVLEPAKGQD
jgi:hypothetical protein